MFGFSLVRTEDLHNLESKVDELIQHISDNAGFVDEKGILSSRSKNLMENATRRKHWSKFWLWCRQVSGRFRSL